MDDELKAVLGRLTQGQEALTQAVQSLTQGQERLTEGQERLTQGQDELRSGLQGVQADLLGLRTVMMERFERVEDRLTSMFEDSSVNMMAISRQHDLRAAERADVDKLISLVLRMEVQMLRLRTDVDEMKKAS